MVETLQRRAFILEPGESLLLAGSALEVALRFGMWERFSAAPQSAIVSNPIIATPLVEYPTEGHPAQVWQRINPAALWHPLFWLPDRLAGRYQIENEDGSITTEDDDTWAVRVALELSASGVYDAESGTWLDVLAMHGLDIEDPATFERVRQWQAGASDPVLDRIDLTDTITLEEDPDWALESALTLMGDLRPASWAILSNDLLVQIDMIADPTNPAADSDPTAVYQAAGTIITMGRAMLPERPTGLGFGFWEGQEKALSEVAATDYAAVLDGPIAGISSALYDVRDANWPHLEALEQVGRAPADSPAP